MRVFASESGRRLTPRALIALAAAAVTVAAGPAFVALNISPASAAVGVPVVGAASGRCLDVIGNVNAPRTGLNIYECNGQANQAWTHNAAGELRVFDDTMCLDVVGEITTSPAVLQILECHGGANQRWKLNPDGSITGVQSGLCLDVVGGSTANSALVQLHTCHGGENQKWTMSGGSGDTVQPSAPGNARVSNLACDSATFSWNASTDNVGVAEYNIWHDGQHMKSVSGSTLSTQLELVQGAKWALYVTAKDAAGNVSQASDEVVVTIPFCEVDTQKPTTPTSLTAAATGTSVALKWGASTDNVAVRFYDIFRDGAKVSSVAANGSTPPPTAFTDSGLKANTRYSYHIVARDAQGNVSGNSNTVSVTTAGGCSNPVCGVKQVTTDTDIPWGLVTLADGTILYNRRDAHDIIHLNPATGAKVNVGTVPNVRSTNGEGGLLGLAISSTFASDHWLYIMHTSPSDNRIVRIKLENDKLDTGSEQVLLTGIRWSKYHNGGRLRFGPDGKLYAATGDAKNGDYAQDRNVLEGKILRLNPDGSRPADNPFDNYVWSYGHRNPQGLAFDSQGRLWEQEFGDGTDETNLITKGGNYGWPRCEGTNGSCNEPGFIAPKRTYSNSAASCSGLTVVRDVVYIACGRGERMYRAAINGSELGSATQYFERTYGRLRTVEPAPDGGLWLTTTREGDKDSEPNNSNEEIFHVTLGS